MAQSDSPLLEMIRGLLHRMELIRCDSSHHSRDGEDEMGLNSVTSQEVFMMLSVRAAKTVKTTNL